MMRCRRRIVLLELVRDPAAESLDIRPRRCVGDSLRCLVKTVWTTSVNFVVFLSKALLVTKILKSEDCFVSKQQKDIDL